MSTQNSKTNYIIVCGYGWTGSSAVVDLLKEVDTTFHPDVEFRIVKDPKGLRDLYESIVENGDPLNVDIAIKEFLWLCKRLNNKRSKFKLNSGLNYKEVFGDCFIESSQSFIESITDFTYQGHWWYLDFIISKPELLKRKLSRFLFKHFYEEMYFSRLNKEQFEEKAKDYIDSIFMETLNRNPGIEFLVLDQAVSAQNCMKEMSFIRNSKLIIVDRDPRDIYVNLLKTKSMIGAEISQTHDVQKYVHWHNALRKNHGVLFDDSDNVLHIYFEDIVCNYENTKKQIFTFLDIDESKHKKRFQYFNPEKSKRNVGLWKDVLNREEIETIERDLEKWLIQDGQ